MSRLTGGSATSVSIGGTTAVNITQVGGAAFALGQQLAASSLPVVLTAAQLTTLTPLATVAATQSGTWNIATVTTVSNISQIASVTPTFTAVTNAAAIAGVLDVLPVGQYNSAPGSITDGRYNHFQLDAKGSLRNVIMDAAGNTRGVNVTASNELVVGGGIASAAADSGNPVKVGGKYNATAPTLTDGQRGDLQVDVNANLKATLATLIAGEDLTNNVLKTEQRFSYATITTATTTTVKSASGFLHGIIVTGGAVGTIDIYDNTAGSGTKIASFDSTAALVPYYFDVSFAIGLTIVTGGATKITIMYR